MTAATGRSSILRPHASQPLGDQALRHIGGDSRRSARSRRARQRARAQAGGARPVLTEFVLEDRDHPIEVRAQLEVAKQDVAGERDTGAWNRPSDALGGFRVVRRLRPSPNVEVPMLEPSLRLERSSMRPVISRTSARSSDDLGVGRGKRPAAAPRQQPQRAQPLASRTGKPPGRRLIARGTGAMMSAQVDIGSTCKCSFTDSRGEDGRRRGGLYVVEGRRLPSIHGDRGHSDRRRCGSERCRGCGGVRSFAAVSDDHGSAECWGGLVK